MKNIRLPKDCHISLACWLLICIYNASLAALLKLTALATLFSSARLWVKLNKLH